MKCLSQKTISFKEFNSLENILIIRNNRPRVYLLQILFLTPLLYTVPFIPLFEKMFLRHDLMGLFLITLYSSITFWGNVIFTFSFWSNFANLIFSTPVCLYDIIFFKFYRIMIEVLVISIFSFLILHLTVVDITLFLVIAAYNLSIGSLIMLLCASFNISRCDLSKGVFMNFEGWGFLQYTILYINLLIPAISFFIISTYYGSDDAKLILLTISVIVLIFHRHFVSLIYKSVLRRKYKILTIFRGN